VDLSEDEADKVLATFDPLGAMAEKDGEQFQQLIREIAATGDTTVLATVFDDYVLDPDLTATWQPPQIDQEAPETSEHHGRSVYKRVEFTAGQFDIVKQAVEQVMAHKTDATQGKALAIICQKYLDQFDEPTDAENQGGP
jgi:hypothetical protein